MSDEIPFTTGSLRDWPLYEEVIDNTFSRAERAAGGHVDPLVREHVLDGMKKFYAVVAKHSNDFAFSATLPLPPGAGTEDRLQLTEAVQAVVHEVVARTRAMVTDLFVERLTLELRMAGLDIGDDQ